MQEEPKDKSAGWRIGVRLAGWGVGVGVLEKRFKPAILHRHARARHHI